MSEKRVVWTNPDGSVSVLIPAPGVPDEVWMKDIPKDTVCKFTDINGIPKDRLFRQAWKLENNECKECPVKSKEVAHSIRRQKREEEFKPHDDAIAKMLPGKGAEAETQRQLIRSKYDVIQTKIDACDSPDKLRICLKEEGLI